MPQVLGIVARSVKAAVPRRQAKAQTTLQSQVAIREMMSPNSRRAADQTNAELKFAN